MVLTDSQWSEFFSKHGLPFDITKQDPHSSLQELGLDSMLYVKLLYAFEDDFGVTLATKDLLAVNTLGELRALFETALAQVDGTRGSQLVT